MKHKKQDVIVFCHENDFGNVMHAMMHTNMFFLKTIEDNSKGEKILTFGWIDES